MPIDVPSLNPKIPVAAVIMNGPSPHHEDDEHEDDVYIDENDIIQEINVDEEGTNKKSIFCTK